jgi:hypothetical protein
VEHRHVADGADAEAPVAQGAQAPNGVGVELVALERARRRLDAEPVERPAMRLASCDRGADERHQREAWDAAVVGHALPVARLVDERLADVEHDGAHGANRSMQRERRPRRKNRRAPPAEPDA